MVALVFLLVIAAVFAAILSSERRTTGLLTWIVSGNWPAKVGGALVIIGVGALLRYAAIHFEAPPPLKLGFGIAAAAALGAASFLTAGRRAISLALGGAAFGVAYLTAYSSFALFGYVPTMQGLGLLALTAIGAGIFAATRSALSLAVLSMIGAFMAPAFAVDDPGPRVVYLYYVAISGLTLLLVAYRGWRPLIHLSFLFTLAGGAFFAWTADYFTSANAGVMYPLIAALVAVHVAMPVVEHRWARSRVVESLDTIYLLSLPVVAALTAFALSPSRAALGAELCWFAGIWFAASAWLHYRQRAGVATHAVIGLLMLGTGLSVQFRDLPWELISLAVAVGSLWLASRRSTSTVLHGVLTGLVILLAAIHVASAVAPDRNSALFLNEHFFERVVGAVLMLLAAFTLRRLRHALDGFMFAVGLGWLLFALGAEVARLQLVSAWLIVHWAFVCAGYAAYFTARRPSLDVFAVPLVFAIALSALLAVWHTGPALATASALLAAGALVPMAFRPRGADPGGAPGRLLPAIVAPVVAALWIACAGLRPGMHWQFPLFAAAAVATGMLLLALVARDRARAWLPQAGEIFGLGFAMLLGGATLFDIERTAWAVGLELVCAGSLVLLAVRGARDEDAPGWFVPAAVVGVALVAQANLLRWLGPAGHLDALDVAGMQWPTLVSLLWASIGAGLTIWSRRIRSRVQWSAGAAFLVGAAVKLLLLDFGSLGQLANILAVIAAGGVFLLVGWLAPMPPTEEAPPRAGEQSALRFAWTVAVIAVVLLSLSQAGSRFGSIDERGFVPAPREPARPPVVAAPSPAPGKAARPASVWFFDCRAWQSVVARNGDYQVHIVEAPAGPRPDDEILSVRLERPQANSVLVLVSDHPVLWNLRPGERSTLAGVWLFSPYEQKLAGVSSRVPVMQPGWEHGQNCPQPHPERDLEALVARTLAANRIESRSRMVDVNIVLDDGDVEPMSAYAGAGENPVRLSR